MPIGAIQRAYSSNTSSHFALPSRTSASCSGCVSSAQIAPAMASRGSFWPPEIASLMLARMLSMFWPEASSTLRIEVLGCLVTTGIMSSIAASMPGGGGMAARLDLLVAGVVGDAVDHRLRPRVHVLKAHVGQPGDVLQAFGRQRQRQCLAEIGFALRRQRVEDAVGMGLELPDPGVAHGARRHRRKHRRALRHMRIAVLAHHVVAHQHVHQPGRLMRREHVDALFLAEDVVAPGEHGRAQLRHERDRRLLPHPGQIRIGIGPECWRRRSRNAGRWT